MRIVWSQWNEAADRGYESRRRVLPTSSEVDIDSVEILREGMCGVDIEATLGSEADAEIAEVLVQFGRGIQHQPAMYNCHSSVDGMIAAVSIPRCSCCVACCG